MTKLKELSPCAGLLPLEIGTVRLSEPEMTTMNLIAPYRGEAAALGKTMKAEHGLDWPSAGQTCAANGAELVWFGLDQAMLIGVEPSAKLEAHAAVTEQSNAWAVVELEGVGARAVLARLTPLDMRDSSFAVGNTARTELFHMQSAITRVSETRWQVIVFRSMAKTLVHDLKVAMEGVAARAL